MTSPDTRPPGVWVVHVTTAGGADAELAADALWQAGAVAIEERPVASGVVLLAAAEPGADGTESGTGPGTGPAGDPGPLMAAVEGRWPAEIVAVDLDAALDAWRPYARAMAVGRFVVRAPWVPRPSVGVGGGGSGGGSGPSGGAVAGGGPTGAGSDGPTGAGVGGGGSGGGSRPSGGTVAGGGPTGAGAGDADRSSSAGGGEPPAVGGRGLGGLAGVEGNEPGGSRHDRPAVDVVIDPGRSFGSGGHASTRLALAALDAALSGGERVLDVGVGSGVLAIAALMAGAASARGVDIDPAALTASRSNAARNGVGDRLTVSRDWPPPDERFDLVLANMLAPTLAELASGIRSRLAPTGTLILSGLLDEQLPVVREGYPGLTVTATETDEDDGWVALTLRSLPGR